MSYTSEKRIIEKSLAQAKIELIHGNLNQREDAEYNIPKLQKEIFKYNELLIKSF